MTDHTNIVIIFVLQQVIHIKPFLKKVLIKSKQFQLFKKVGTFLLFGFVFSLIYTQEPLYSSNQNNYLFHGLAKAGQGYLQNDYYYETTTPFPVFTLVVYLTARYLDPWFFYFYQFILSSIYIYSLLKILEIYTGKTSKYFLWINLCLISLIHSRIIDIISFKIFGISIPKMLHGGLAQYYILGTIFQPSAFGVLFILSIFLFLKRKLLLATIVSCLPSIIHPTYLLFSLLFIVIYAVIDFYQRKSLTRAFSYIILPITIISAIFVYNVIILKPTSVILQKEALHILLYSRSPHHFDYRQWLNAGSYVQLIIMVSGLYFTRKTLLFWITMPLLLFSLFSTLVVLIADKDTLTFLAPWRISIILMPIFSSINIINLVLFLFRFKKTYQLSDKIRQLIRTCCQLIIIILMLGGSIVIIIKSYQYYHNPLTDMMNFVKSSRESQNNYLLPIQVGDANNSFQYFRLYTGVPVFVDYKSHPHKDVQFLAWYKRIILAAEIYKKADCSLLAQTAKQHRLTHIVIDSNNNLKRCDFLLPVYNDVNYSVNKINY